MGRISSGIAPTAPSSRARSASSTAVGLEVDADLLAVDLVREPEHDEASLELRHAAEELALDRERAPLVAVADDDLLDPPGDEEVRLAAVEVEEALVAGPQPAVVAEHGRRGRGVAEVLEHRAVAADAELAALAFGGSAAPSGPATFTSVPESGLPIEVSSPP